jgi:hypothetical protein
MFFSLVGQYLCNQFWRNIARMNIALWIPLSMKYAQVLGHGKQAVRINANGSKALRLDTTGFARSGDSASVKS